MGLEMIGDSRQEQEQQMEVMRDWLPPTRTTYRGTFEVMHAFCYEKCRRVMLTAPYSQHIHQSFPAST
ncbi:hypothetical protein E2C01_102508 [Portunus trituberculatus]|uniref:Uncharacterized protein n=1 Tax=Portunus trituberculatus TaxID=210409 RepID=A0A5B7KII6_PORTR|nr:hypothetical protein [Portunus trituberculatus]